MNDISKETPELQEILAVLMDSGPILREGTRLERQKRWRLLDGGLEGALAACRLATEEGRKNADEYLYRTRAALQQARDSMEKVARSRGRLGSVNQESDLMDQLGELLEELEGQLFAIDDVLNRKSGQPSAYNITLFGRTGAGKSTLMEILTNGEGRTIGKGAQRTTRDVRSYEWRGLKITDVPGVAAFDGEDDAETAHQAAKEADLILFLITDDGPQQAEASHLARLRRTGHPVIAICNVKKAVRGEAGKRQFVRDSHKTFDPCRLEEISRQFDEMTDQSNPGQELPFMYTHLLARFTANRTPQEELAEGLKEESRFWEVEDSIAEQIAENGAYLRTRSYTDMATESALEASELLLQSAFVMGQLQDRIGARVAELKQWRTSLKSSAGRSLEELLENTTGKLRSGMTRFAERNWKDKNISQLWNQEIESVDISHQVQTKLEQLHREMVAYLSKIESDLATELRLLATLHTEHFRVDMGSPNRRRWVRWASTAIGAVSALVGTGLMFIPGGQLLGLGAALAIGGGILPLAKKWISRLSKPEKEQRREAVEEFREKALPHIKRMENQVRSLYRKTFDEEIDRKGASSVISEFSAMVESAKEAGAIARQLGIGQQTSLADLNRMTVSQVLAHTGPKNQAFRIQRAARIPGQAMALVVPQEEEPGEELLGQMEAMLGERITTIRVGTSDSSILRKATGTKNLRIDQEAGTAEADYDAADPAVEFEVRLASQLTGLHVLNRRQEAQ